MWLMLRGECFRVPIFEGRKLKSILYLDPAQVHHIVEDHELIGWRYSGGGNQAPLASQVFLPEEVWFERLPNPFHFWRGMPPLMVADLPARTDHAAASFMRGFVENNADLGVIVHTEQQLTAEQQTQIIADLRNRKRKAGTADRPCFFPAGRRSPSQPCPAPIFSFWRTASFPVQKSAPPLVSRKKL